MKRSKESQEKLYWLIFNGTILISELSEKMVVKVSFF